MLQEERITEVFILFPSPSPLIFIILVYFIFERGINQVQTELITDPVRTGPLKACAVKELQGMYSCGCWEGEKGRGISHLLTDT